MDSKKLTRGRRRSSPLQTDVRKMPLGLVILLNIDRSLKAGFFSYLTKPIKINELMMALDVALDYATGKASQ